MYGQGYRNKADRISRIRANKKGGYAQDEKHKPKHGTERQHLIKPSAFESEIHPSHKLRLCSVYFAAGSYAADRRISS